jgi:hypothetical protein
MSAAQLPPGFLGKDCFKKQGHVLCVGSAAAEISCRERLVRAGLKKKENPQKERKINKKRMPGLSGQETMRQFTQLLAAIVFSAFVLSPCVGEGGE